ncbi:MAG: YraN family protein [Candidatus Sulfobium sp.]|jgi:putative endonuclease
MNAVGREGEEIALAFFRDRGYRILEKNYRTVFGEIDIIARDRDVLVFIEVKARTDDAFGSPFEAVHKKKREKIRKVALCFMKKLRKEVPARFDVLSIERSRTGHSIEHIKDAFEV